MLDIRDERVEMRLKMVRLVSMWRMRETRGEQDARMEVRWIGWESKCDEVEAKGSDLRGDEIEVVVMRKVRESDDDWMITRRDNTISEAEE